MARAKHEDYAKGKHDEDDNRKHLNYYYMPVTDSKHFTLNTTVISSSCVQLQKGHKFHPFLNICMLLCNAYFHSSYQGVSLFTP